MEEPPVGAAFGPSYPAATPVCQYDESARAEAQRQPGVAGGGAPGLVERALHGAGGVFGGDFGRVVDDFAESLQNGGTRGDDWGAGGGRVPVSFVLVQC